MDLDRRGKQDLNREADYVSALSSRQDAMFCALYAVTKVGGRGLRED